MELSSTSLVADRSAWIAEHAVIAPAAALPMLRVLSTDPGQEIVALAPNRIAFLGDTTMDCLVTVLVDGTRFAVRLPEGLSAEHTALRLSEAMPRRFPSEVVGSVLTVWKSTEDIGLAA